MPVEGLQLQGALLKALIDAALAQNRRIITPT
jgi:hypothetical protein